MNKKKEEPLYSYELNKNYLIDMKNFFLEFKIPVLPVKARDLIDNLDKDDQEKILGKTAIKFYDLEIPNH